MRLSRCVLAVQLLVAGKLVHLRVHDGTSGDLARPPGLLGTSKLAQACDPVPEHHCSENSQLCILFPPLQDAALNQGRRIADREDDYRKRRLARMISPARNDAFAMGDQTPDARVSTYADRMRESQLARERDNTLQVVKPHICSIAVSAHPVLPSAELPHGACHPVQACRCRP